MSRTDPPSATPPAGAGWRIDVHAHFLPDAGRRAFRTGTDWHGTTFTRNSDGILVSERDGKRFVFGSPQHFETMAQRVQRMDARQVDTELLSLLPPLFGYSAPAADAAAAARDVNDELSALSTEFGATGEPYRPGRFLGLATLPLQDVPAAVAELARAMALPGMVGVTLGTHINGVNLDDERLVPFWQAAGELGAFVFIHPMDQRGRAAMGKYYLRNAIGNPWETTVAAASLMLSGRLAELPDLPVCLAHGGGYVLAAIGRLEHAFKVRPENAGNPQRSPRAQVRRFLFDTLNHDEQGLRHMVDVLGVDRVVLGTDFPADMGQTDAVAEIGASPLFTDEEKAAMLGGNVARILGDRLPAAAAAG
jgi:aminocarboxymuconate-semialdehyde decarboxylase